MNRLTLAQVTLCAVDCDTPALSARALLQAQRGIAFGRVVLFTRGWLPTVVLPGLEVVDIAPLDDAAARADFVARRLHAYVNTSHVMLLRWDAGVLDAAAWNDEFLVPDYLAALPAPGDGSGPPGLSLRSRRWLRAGADPRFTEPLLDDGLLCGAHRGFLQAVHGVHFAPEALARRFAAVGDAAGGGCLGFVGAEHLPAQLGDAETLELVRRLPAGFVDGPGVAAFEAALRARRMGAALEALQQRQHSRRVTGSPTPA